MGSFVAARSLLRSSSAAGRFASAAKSAARSPLGAAAKSPLSHRTTFRCARQMSFCVESLSLMPYHTATASALMTSMLSVSRRSCGWLTDACLDDA